MKLKLIFSLCLSLLIQWALPGQVKVQDTGVTTIGTDTGTGFNIGNAKVDLMNNLSNKQIGLNINHQNYTGNKAATGNSIYLTNQGTGRGYGVFINVDAAGTRQKSGCEIVVKENAAATEPVFGVNCLLDCFGPANQSAGIKGVVKVDTTSTNTKYGVYGQIKATGGSFGTGGRYAVYGKINANDPDHFAGYFDGGVCIVGGQCSGSDRRLKRQIRPLDDALEMLNDLSPKRYKFKDNILGMTLPAGEQLGLIAQDVERILPEVVSEITTPIDDEEDPSGKERIVSYKAINYQALVPLLIGAIKEQQELIKDLEKRVERLED